ncbi:type II secretion system protein [bacterium]|nr:type II secretion system protein [bacterium]
MNQFRHHTRAFTLIELLVVISIIAIMTAIMTANFSTARSKSRDAKRISDISNIQLALALYFDRCGVYPSSPLISTSLTATDSNCPTGITLGSFLGTIPTPPTPATDSTDYRYAVNSSKTNYVLAARLENNNSVLTDALSAVPSDITGPSATFCDKATFNYCVGPK